MTKKWQLTGIPKESSGHITAQASLNTLCGEQLDLDWSVKNLGNIYQVTCRPCRQEYANYLSGQNNGSHYENS